VFAACALAISAIDVEHMRIPTPLVYAAVALGVPLLVLASAGTHRWSGLLSAAVAGAVVFVAFLALFLAVPKGIGFGDVRFAGLCAGFLGWFGYREALVGFMLSFLVAGLLAVVLLAMHKVQRRTRIAFGPFLAAGTMLAVLFGTPIMHAWIGH
jgi:leader peptidase (prepilin peptidase)/N-methyltransferase